MTFVLDLRVRFVHIPTLLSLLARSSHKDYLQIGSCRFLQLQLRTLLDALNVLWHIARDHNLYPTQACECV